jgi:tRNA threonylcarbamoyladenosine biosynthesis protein TsaE
VISPDTAVTIVTLADEAATLALGARLARLARPGDVIALEGDLGAGKTTLARGFIRALCGAELEVPSPTFTLVQTYEAPDATIWHFDFYRLERPEEAWELDIEEAFAEGISLLEWPERLGALLPRKHLAVRLELEPRRARLIPSEGWAPRLEGRQ